MADEGRIRPAQRAHSSNHISFGHFGTAIYNEHSQSWTFLRQPVSKDRLHDRAETIFSPFRPLRDPLQILETRARSDSHGGAGSKLSTRELLKGAAEAAPVVAQVDLRSYMNGARQPSDRTSRLLLAFGNVMVLGDDDVPSGFATLPAAAVVKPEEPDRLLLTLLGSEIVRASVDSDESSSVRFPVILDQHSTSWSSYGDPIQDVRFSYKLPSRRGVWVAVRRANFINIFQPLYHRVEASSYHGTETTSSLDPNPVVEISSFHTGNQPFADVAFHPQEPRSFIVIDIGGNWSIWKLHGTRPRSTHVSYRVQLKINGHVSARPDLLVQYDGWHKTTWLSSRGEAIDRFLICNRQSMHLFDLRGNKLSEVDLRIGSRLAGSILDFVTTMVHSNIFVLTESHVFIVSVTGRQDSLVEDHNGLAVLAYWSHLQGYTDMKLKIHTVQSSQSTWLFLTNASSPGFTAYQCMNVQQDNSPSFSVSDPVWLDLSSPANKNLQVLSFHPVAAEVVRPKENLTSGFFKVFLQDSSGHFFDTLHQFVDESVRKGPRSENEVPLPNKQLLHHKSASHIRPSIDDEGPEGFVVADSWVDCDHLDSTGHDARHAPDIPYGEERVSTVLVCDLRRTYDSMASRIQPSYTGDRTTFESMFHEIQRRFEKGPSDAPLCSELILELLFSTPYVAEIEDDSRLLESWLHNYTYAEEGMDSQQNRRFRTIEKSLIEIYNDMADKWISPMSVAIPSRLRVQRERLIRQIALQALLSSVTLKPFPPSERDVGKASHVEDSDNRVPESSGLVELAPLDSSVFTDGTVFPSSPPEGSGEPAAVRTRESRSVLSQYVYFTPPATGDSKSSAVVDNILSHLPVSADEDPASYSYENRELDLALARHELMTQKLGAKGRRKAERLSRNHRKKLERQAQSKKVAFEQSSAIPSIMSSQLPIRGIQSSQAAVPSPSQTEQDRGPQISMTQPERGVYGTREGRTTKSKGKGNRLKGF